MDGVAIVEKLVQILVSGITGMGTGIGAGVNNFVTALAIDTSGETAQLSIFLGFVGAFAAIALAVGLTRRVFGWLETLSGRN